MRITKIILAFFILGCFACNSSGTSADCPNAETFEVVDLTGLDGCGLVLKNQSGDRFEAVNLLEMKPEIQAGDNIKAEIKIETQLASICQVGQIVTILCIQ